MLNRFPLWKNLSLIVILIVAVLYALPNLYGENPSVQVTGNNPQAKVGQFLVKKINTALASNNLKPKSVTLVKGNILVRFANTNQQFKALNIIRASLGQDYTVAVNLAPATPAWLQAIGAAPMKKGLDLQGGIHFLLDVDIPSAIAKRLNGMVRNMSDQLRKARLRYDNITKNGKTIVISFRDKSVRDQALNNLIKNYPNLTFTKTQKGKQYQLRAVMTSNAVQKIREYTIDQTLTTLRNRVNELGISEPLVQQQGANQISVDLPGVQDSAQAKQILGGTATLEFHLVNNSSDLNSVLSTGIAPPGTKLYRMTSGQPILLDSQVVLSGNSITSAFSTLDQSGQPAVNITLGGGGETYFNQVTRQNIGNRMAIVYISTRTENKMVAGKLHKIRHKTEQVISAPVIQNALGTQFQITGLNSRKQAKNLAILLRSGAMPVNIDIVEERTVGASLGEKNIQLGMLSVEVAFLLIVIFMAIYYSVFGIIADIALTLNLLLIVAILSILGATLTLPGIAGIVLTVGMAVDANVLIFERIREELRNGVTPQASIHAGFERAFSTIVDANVTTLIVAVVLFSIGSGPIKGFAITLSIGILTSMFTAITFTRGLVNWIYGGKTNKRLAIGIKYSSVKTQERN